MKHPFFVIVVLLAITGCASPAKLDTPADLSVNVTAEISEPDESKSDIDPFEPANRVLWDFNWQVLDKYLLKPATTAYTTVLPGFLRTGLRNAARNLEEPGNTVNNLFQGKGKDSAISLSRFIVNSTVGLFGLIDVANSLGMSRKDEDLDETLAVWGVGSGPFLMVPALGPNDTRGLVGDIGDNIAFPMTVLSSPLNVGRIVINILETRASLMASEQQIRQSLDDYTFVKNAYFQNKQFTIDNNQLTDTLESDIMDDFEDFEAWLDEETDVPNPF